MSKQAPTPVNDVDALGHRDIGVHAGHLAVGYDIRGATHRGRTVLRPLRLKPPVSPLRVFH